MTVGSLFSGIGGIDLAFQQAGFEVKWAIEKDEACCKTYRYNFPSVNLLESDIHNVDPVTLTKVDVIVAGFPCQSFSVAGNQRGFSDPRGNAFFAIEKFIRWSEPRYVFLENVPNLMDHDDGKTFNVIHNTLSELGYTIRYRVLRASEYGGVPQIRDRIYIVAFRELEECEQFRFPDPIELKITIEDILQRNIRKHPVYYYSSEDPYYEKAKSIVTRKDAIYRVYHDSIKITQNHMCPTLTASMGIKPNQVHLVLDDYGLRKLTIQECLDFQGFPKSFRFPKMLSIDEAYKQIGNSVSVPVIEKIARQIKIL